MNRHTKTRKITANGIARPQYAPLLVPTLQLIAGRVSILRSDAWLLLNLHLERNPTGPHRRDISVRQSFFEHILKYASNRPAAMNPPQNPGPLNFQVDPFNPPHINQNINNEVNVTRYHLWESAYQFFHRCNSDDYGSLTSYFSLEWPHAATNGS